MISGKTVLEGEMVMVGGIPRRAQTMLMTPNEILIHAAINQINKFGTDPLLTETIDLLKQAFETLADYTEKAK